MQDLLRESKVSESCEAGTKNSDFDEYEISLTVQQTSELTGLSEHNLRYYERVGLIKPVSRQFNSRHRRYSSEDVARIHSLVCLIVAELQEVPEYQS